MGNKILVTFTLEQMRKIESLRGMMGNTRADVVRNCVLLRLLSTPTPAPEQYIKALG